MEISGMEPCGNIQDCQEDDNNNRQVDGETFNTTEDQLSDDNIDDDDDHNRIEEIGLNSGELNYQLSNEEYTVPVQATSVKIVKVVPLPHARSDVWRFFGFIADDEGEIQDKKKAICKLCAVPLAYSGNTTNLFTHLKSMHPEANPDKMAPTNRTPRTGRKSGKRKYFELGDGSFEAGSTVSMGSDCNQSSYIIRAITYSGNESGSSSASFFEDGANTITNSPNSNSISSGVNKSANVKAISVATPTVISSSGTGSPTHGMTPNIANSENVPLLSCEDITNAIVNMLVEDCRPVCVTQGKGFEELMKLLAPGYKIPEPSKLKPLVKKRHKEYQRDLILRGLEDD